MSVMFAVSGSDVVHQVATRPVDRHQLQPMNTSTKNLPYISY